MLDHVDKLLSSRFKAIGLFAERLCTVYLIRIRIRNILPKKFLHAELLRGFFGSRRLRNRNGAFMRAGSCGRPPRQRHLVSLYLRVILRAVLRAGSDGSILRRTVECKVITQSICKDIRSIFGRHITVLLVHAVLVYLFKKHISDFRNPQYLIRF